MSSSESDEDDFMGDTAKSLTKSIQKFGARYAKMRKAKTINKIEEIDENDDVIIETAPVKAASSSSSIAACSSESPNNNNSSKRKTRSSQQRLLLEGKGNEKKTSSSVIEKLLESKRLAAAEAATLTTTTQESTDISSPTTINMEAINVEERLTALSEKCGNLIDEVNDSVKLGRGSKRKATKKQLQNKRRGIVVQKNKMVPVDDVITIETDEEELKEATIEEQNPTVTLNLLWKSIYKKQMRVRKFDNLSVIIDYLVDRYAVDAKLLYVTIDDMPVKLDEHTYVSLQLDETKTIEASVLLEEDSDISYTSSIPTKQQQQSKVQSEVSSSGSSSEDAVSFYLQYQNDKQKTLVYVGREQKLEMLYARAMQEKHLQFNQFKVMFDGAMVLPTDTIASLGLELGDCFDVVMV